MIFTIAGKELKTLFASPLAWVVLTMMQLIAGYAFRRRLDDFLQLQSQLAQMGNPPGVTELVAGPVFGTAAAGLLFAVPVLAMRLVAGERRNQTMVLLLAATGAFATLLGRVLAGEAAGDGLRARGWTVAASLTQVFSPIKSFEPFGRGLFDSYAAACLVLLTALSLALG